MDAPRRISVRIGLVSLALVSTSMLAATAGSSYADRAPAAAAGAPHVQAPTPTVISQRTIGMSVRGHAIRAYEMGSRSAPRSVVLIGAMHGNETEGSTVISELMRGRPIRGVHIWAVRRDNPDGVLAGHRRNAHDVDLNRNFPTSWRRLHGNYNSGPRPASEPETRALMRFLDRVNPDHVVTMHSPLRGIDVYGAKDRPFARRLSHFMHLPTKSFDCAGVCHGTLTQWFNRNHRGACVTVEFGENATSHYLQVRAPRGVVRAVGGRYMTER